MKIYIEIDKNKKDKVIFRNNIDNIDVFRYFFENHIFTFDFFQSLKGDKELLNKAFKEELYQHTLN